MYVCMLITMHSWTVFVRDICDADIESDQDDLFRKHYTDYRLLVECAFEAVYLDMGSELEYSGILKHAIIVNCTLQMQQFHTISVAF